MLNNQKLKRIPTLQELQRIEEYINERGNKNGEYLRKIHLSIFLLTYKAGLRVSEAIEFDLRNEHPASEYKNLYQLRGKGHKDRYVYLEPQIAKLLRSNGFLPNSTNRVNFWLFLKVIKKELNLDSNVELSPHTLRRCFATYNAIGGMPLPVLQKILGHSRISTTALYIKGTDLDNLLKWKPRM